MLLAHTKNNRLAVVALSLLIWIRGRQINWLAECLADFCCLDIVPMKGEQIALIAAGLYKVLLVQRILNTVVKCTAAFVYYFVISPFFAFYSIHSYFK